MTHADTLRLKHCMTKDCNNAQLQYCDNCHCRIFGSLIKYKQ